AVAEVAALPVVVVLAPDLVSCAAFVPLGRPSLDCALSLDIPSLDVPSLDWALSFDMPLLSLDMPSLDCALSFDMPLLSLDMPSRDCAFLLPSRPSRPSAFI